MKKYMDWEEYQDKVLKTKDVKLMSEQFKDIEKISEEE